MVLAVPGFSQSITGTISGTVTDPAGGMIPGAAVTLVSEKDGTKRNVVTNDEGRFQFSTVQPGPYTIKIERDGFQTLQHTNTILSC